MKRLSGSFYSLQTPLPKPIQFFQFSAAALGISTLLLASPHSFASTGMSLNDYLSQVKNSNPEMKSFQTLSEAGELQSSDGQLILAPTVFANVKLTSDAKIQAINFVGYNSIQTNTYSLGVSQVTTWGMEAKLRYDLFTQAYINPVAPPIPGVPLNFSFANASPVLEIKQSLWGNGFGRSTQASVDLAESKALATSYANRFKLKASLAEAEGNYWNLAAARQTVSVQKEALDRAQKIYEWNTRRNRLHLGEQSDVLQAEAMLRMRELELQAAQNEERSAARKLNTSRNVDSDEVSEKVTELTPETLAAISLPKRDSVRDDVKAAEQTAKLQSATAKISIEKNLPTLDITASAALNGQQGYRTFNYISETIPPSFSFNRPTYSVGLSFSAPLDFSLISKSKQGARLESEAAELAYNQKLFEQESNWKDLTQSLQEAKQRLDLSEKIETIQLAKLKNEKNQLNQGRSTTYQVLLFEQDFLLSQLSRIRNQAGILSVMAKMKVFGENL